MGEWFAMSGGRSTLWRERVSPAFRAYADLGVALGIVVAVGTVTSIDIHSVGLLLLLASALAGVTYLAVTTITMIVWLVRARWGRAAVSATKTVAFVALLGPCLRAGDYVHLALFYPIYRQQIAALKGGNTVPVRFDWGDKALWVTDGFQGETLVYDPTDALAASVDEIRPSKERGFTLATRHLVGHFYIEFEASS